MQLLAGPHENVRPRNVGIGSPKPTFWMDEARGYLTVRIQVHPAFLSAPHGPSKRDIEYRARIEEKLAGGPLSLTELSRAMGYKSIPKRLSQAVETMASEGIVAKVASGGMRSKIALVVR